MSNTTNQPDPTPDQPERKIIFGVAIDEDMFDREAIEQIIDNARKLEYHQILDSDDLAGSGSCHVVFSNTPITKGEALFIMTMAQAELMQRITSKN